MHAPSLNLDRRWNGWKLVGAADTGTESLVLFPEPHIWGGTVSESWTLMKSSGEVICYLPCSASVGPSSGYVLEGGGYRRNHGSDKVTTLSAQIELPAYIRRPPSGTLVAHVYEPQGRIGRLVLGIVGGVFLATGTTLLLVTLEDRNLSLGAVILMGFGGFASETAGIACALTAILLAVVRREREPEVEFVPAAPSTTTARKASSVRVMFSPLGVVGSF
jgi:hypothetical protein